MGCATAKHNFDMENDVMCTKNMKLETLETLIVRFAFGLASSAVLLLLLSMLLAASLAKSSFAQDAQLKTFATPVEATNALFEAVQKQDEQSLEAILGAGKEVTSSSDEEEDKLEREQFSKKYQEMHRLVREPDGTTVLYIGAENWPFPVPLVSKNGSWYFDSDQGKQEILFRRIGENEMTAIEVCEQFAMARTEDGSPAVSEDPITRFVQNLVSDNAANNPFHGYYFRMVPNNAPSQVSSGQEKKGLTLVAYPAEYHSSGVMTFVVTRNGIVFERDLGANTANVAPKIKVRTGSSWHPAS